MGKLWIAGLIVYNFYILQFSVYFFFQLCKRAELAANACLFINLSILEQPTETIKPDRAALNLNFQMSLSKHYSCSQHLTQCLPH